MKTHEECIFWHENEQEPIKCWLCDILNDRDAWKKMAEQLLESLERERKLNGKY